MFLRCLAAAQPSSLSFTPRALRCRAWCSIRPVGSAERPGGSRETGCVSKPPRSCCTENASLPVLAGKDKGTELLHRSKSAWEKIL